MILSSLAMIEIKESEVKEAPLQVYTNVHIKHFGDWGTWEESSSNVLTSVGSNLTTDYLASGDGAAVDYIGVGNGTVPTQGSTSLNNEIAESGLSRAQGAISNINGNITITIEFTYSGSAALPVNTTGLWNASSGDEGFFAADEFTDRTLQENDKLNITWSYWAT